MQSVDSAWLGVGHPPRRPFCGSAVPATLRQCPLDGGRAPPSPLASPAGETAHTARGRQRFPLTASEPAGGTAHTARGRQSFPLTPSEPGGGAARTAVRGPRHPQHRRPSCGVGSVPGPRRCSAASLASTHSAARGTACPRRDHENAADTPDAALPGPPRAAGTAPGGHPQRLPCSPVAGHHGTPGTGRELLASSAGDG